MRRIVYTCDWCEKEFGNKKHLNISLNHNLTGVSTPHKNGLWKIMNKVGGVMQFCGGKCLGAFFSEQMKKGVE